MLSMVLYLIGLGLWDQKDISVKGRELVKNSDLVYLEDYTSRLMGTSTKDLEDFFGKKIKVLDRKGVEQTKEYLQKAKDKKVALLIGGSPTIATTHIEIIQEAKRQGIKYKVIHNASIQTAVCESGLFSYNFGKSCSIPFPQEGFKPESFYDIIRENMKQGVHTIVFLDLKPKEDRFMNINTALSTLIRIGEKRKKEINLSTLAVGFARIGSDDQIIKAGKISELLDFDFGGPLHTLVIPGKLHFMEKEALGMKK